MTNGTATEGEGTREQADLLLKTSRTFALSIPLLPEPTRSEVTTAYLLFRIADTFEDGVNWEQHARRQALADFVGLLHRPSARQARRMSTRWSANAPIDHAGYLELLQQTPQVLDGFWKLDPAARAAIESHVMRTAEGMSGFVSRTTPDGRLELHTLLDLRDYCYVVAGIVGEMLTELFLLSQPKLANCAPELREHAPLFGEGLQLTNILKDSAADRGEGRAYLPQDTDRAEVFALAREDLERAAKYTRALQSHEAPRGMVAFNALPLLLARATLDCVQTQGPGTKITRSEVFGIIASMNDALDAGSPVA